jgi:hypothetical protein
MRIMICRGVALLGTVLTYSKKKQEGKLPD